MTRDLGLRQPAGTALARATARLTTAQGAYYVLSGLWPLLSRRSFETLPGPKTDWLAGRGVARG
jgi:hypothetical protein